MPPLNDRLCRLSRHNNQMYNRYMFRVKPSGLYVNQLFLNKNLSYQLEEIA
jgi:hypothetical protein